VGLVRGRNVLARYVYFGLRVVESFIKVYLCIFYKKIRSLCEEFWAYFIGSWIMILGLEIVSGPK
jgi:hypothetical protein